MVNRRDVLLRSKRKLNFSLVSSGHSPWKCGDVHVNRCALLTLLAFWYVQARHTCSALRVLALVQWPGASLYLPVPQSPLSPAAMPECSMPPSFLYPSFLFQAISIILHLSGIYFRLLTFSSQILFITLIIKLFSLDLSVLPVLLFLLSLPGLQTYLPSTRLSCSHSHPRAALSCCSSLPPLSLWRSSTRMSDSHILAFRQPLALKESSILNQSCPLGQKSSTKPAA